MIDQIIDFNKGFVAQKVTVFLHCKVEEDPIK